MADREIILSSEVSRKLMELAERMHRPASRMLADMIIERHSVSDTEKNRLRRNANWEKYLASGTQDKTQRQIWMNGYICGWIDFQLRHADEGIVILYQDAPPDEEE